MKVTIIILAAVILLESALLVLTLVRTPLCAPSFLFVDPTPGAAAVPTRPPGKAGETIYGDRGRLYINGTNVALYNGLEQETCDAEDSACCLDYKSVVIIADHSHQGFDTIKECHPGDVCVIKHEDGTFSVYDCVRVEPNGENLESDLIDSKGDSVFDSGVDMVMYTCNESWVSVTLVYWQELTLSCDK